MTGFRSSSLRRKCANASVVSGPLGAMQSIVRLAVRRPPAESGSRLHNFVLKRRQCSRLR